MVADRATIAEAIILDAPARTRDELAAGGNLRQDRPRCREPSIARRTWKSHALIALDATQRLVRGVNCDAEGCAFQLQRRAVPCSAPCRADLGARTCGPPPERCFAQLAGIGGHRTASCLRRAPATISASSSFDWPPPSAAESRSRFCLQVFGNAGGLDAELAGELLGVSAMSAVELGQARWIDVQARFAGNGGRLVTASRSSTRGAVDRAPPPPPSRLADRCRPATGEIGGDVASMRLERGVVGFGQGRAGARRSSADGGLSSAALAQRATCSDWVSCASARRREMASSLQLGRSSFRKGLRATRGAYGGLVRRFAAMRAPARLQAAPRRPCRSRTWTRAQRVRHHGRRNRPAGPVARRDLSECRGASCWPCMSTMSCPGPAQVAHLRERDRGGR